MTLYNLTTLLEQPTNIQASIIARYQGDRAYGRYGDVVKFVDVDGDGKDELIIASPRRSKDITEEFYGGTGNLSLFNLLIFCKLSSLFF